MTYSKLDMLYYHAILTADQKTNTNKQNENEKLLYEVCKSYPSTVTRQPSRGEAGQPRRSRLRRPSRPPKVPAKDSANKPRNTNRGLRSKLAIEKLKKNRQIKRNTARRLHRASRRILEAPLQEPQLPAPHIELKQILKIGSLNVRGLIAAGKRKEIEAYMFHKQIHILMIQETHPHRRGNQSNRQTLLVVLLQRDHHK